MFQPKARTTNKPNKRKIQSSTVINTPSVCDLVECPNSQQQHRQVSLTQFFGQPRKKISSVVSPQTPPSSKRLPSAAATTTKTRAGISPESLDSREKNPNSPHHNSHFNNNKTVKIKKKHKTEQLYLDFGQASFGKRTECPYCGTLYVEGVVEDDEAHDRVCRDFKEGVTVRMTILLKSNKQHFILGIRDDEYVIEVRIHVSSFLIIIFFWLSVTGYHNSLHSSIVSSCFISSGQIIVSYLYIAQQVTRSTEDRRTRAWICYRGQ